MENGGVVNVLLGLELWVATVIGFLKRKKYKTFA